MPGGSEVCGSGAGGDLWILLCRIRGGGQRGKRGTYTGAILCILTREILDWRADGGLGREGERGGGGKVETCLGNVPSFPRPSLAEGVPFDSLEKLLGGRMISGKSRLEKNGFLEGGGQLAYSKRTFVNGYEILGCSPTGWGRSILVGRGGGLAFYRFYHHISCRRKGARGRSTVWRDSD